MIEICFVEHCSVETSDNGARLSFVGGTPPPPPEPVIRSVSLKGAASTSKCDIPSMGGGVTFDRYGFVHGCKRCGVSVHDQHASGANENTLEKKLERHFVG